jgi:BirA family biotin operon repressor/biotin-[acetyl-CoA-carboxylase] ligase
MFDIPRITKSGLFRHVDYHASLGSTSDRALELATCNELPLPLLVLTERQTGGRGRGTNRWWSAPGALTFSLVLEATALPPDARSRVALVAGLAVCEALEQLVPRAEWRVKWPNDVYASGGKICGILCETAPGYSERLIVGIGINVNNSTARGQGSAPAGAVALIDLEPLPRELTEVLLAVLDRFDLRWSELLAGRFGELASAYREGCLLTGKTVTVTSGEQRLVGQCRGINDRGALVLATENGTRTIVAGSIDAWE